MPKIFEIFGYPITDKSVQATTCRRAGACPFMGADCDGGGNRCLSHIHPKPGSELYKFFDGKTEVPSGVCSIQIQSNPWIVCPRRLLVMGRENVKKVSYQDAVHQLLIQKAKYPKGTTLGVWSEVKVKTTQKVGGVSKSFDYTFDYIIAPLKRTSKSTIEKETKLLWSKIEPSIIKNGYTISIINGEQFVEDFPCGPPTIIEIMTSSTSGGNKTKRTTIPNAFEDAILNKEHQAPGINYRQVWARMASQLIVKSEVGIRWGGSTIWVLQDTLIDYISNSTALDIRKFLAQNINEVNIMSFSYGGKTNSLKGVIQLEEGKLYSGPIKPTSERKEDSFQDIIRTPYTPPVEILWKHLVDRKRVNIIKV